MAETSGFFNAEMVEGDGSTTYDRIYYADQFAYYFSKFISNGVYINPATQLKVTSKGELKLNVAVGDAFINGYWYKNDENFELQLAQANGSLPRIDRVVLRWDSLTRYINLAILQGNPAATPSAKNLTRNADTWELGLADVYIERGVLSISDANITDLRPDRTYCGYVAGVVNQIDTTNLFAQFTDAFEQYYEKQVTASDKFSSDLAKKYNDYAVLAETNFGKWMTDTKGDFDTWYETIQAMLSDEEAIKLANQISELKKQFQLLALRGLKTDLFELASNDGSVFTENAQNAYVFLEQIYGKSELVNDAFISVGESGALEFDSVDATNENVSSAKLTTGMPLRGFIIDDVSAANYTDANGKYWLCDSIELSVDGYWYCIKRVGSILSYNSESVGSIYKTPTGTLDKGKQVLYKLSDYVVSKLTDEEQSQLSELLSYGGGKLPVTTGSNAAEAIQLHVEQNVTDENGVHNIRFRNGSLQYKEGSEWKDITVNADVSVATKENAGKVKPDGKSMSVDESGTLSINLDGATITLDEARNVIKLADALKDKIGTALQPESIINNQTTTVEGFALDARQANPNVEGTLAKQVSNTITNLAAKANIEYFGHDIYNSWMQTPLRENGKYAARTFTAFDNILGAYCGMQLLGTDSIDSTFNGISSRLGYIPTVLDTNADLNNVIGNCFIQAHGCKNVPKSGLNFYGLNISWLGDTNFIFQLLIGPNEELISGSKNPRLYMRSKNAGIWTSWFIVTGTLLS